MIKLVAIIYICTLVPSFLIARAIEKRGGITCDHLRAFLRIWIVSPIGIPYCLFKAIQDVYKNNH